MQARVETGGQGSVVGILVELSPEQCRSHQVKVCTYLDRLDEGEGGRRERSRDGKDTERIQQQRIHKHTKAQPRRSQLDTLQQSWEEEEKWALLLWWICYGALQPLSLFSAKCCGWDQYWIFISQ